MVTDEPPGLFFTTATEPPDANLNDSTQWPSLWAGVGPSVGPGVVGTKSPSPSDDASWEVISPTTLDPSNSANTTMSTPQMVPPLLVEEEDEHIMEEGDHDDDPVVVLPKLQLPSRVTQATPLIRQRSASTPDFISLERKMSMAEDDAEQEEIIRHYTNNVAQGSYPHHSRGLTWTGSISFRDMVLSQGRELAKEVTPVGPPTTGMSTRTSTTKPKPKIVVTPRMRSYESSPNLYGLTSYSTTTITTTSTAAPMMTKTRREDENDDDLILGDTDAMEYYFRKAKGISGRKNGMKLRPDEAKRLDIVMAKKEMQRQQQPPSIKASKK